MKIIICCIETKDGVITHLGWKKEGDKKCRKDKKHNLIEKINIYKKTENVEIETICHNGETPKSVLIIDNKYFKTGGDKNTKNDLLDLPACEKPTIKDLTNSIVSSILDFFKSIRQK